MAAVPNCTMPVATPSAFNATADSFQDLAFSAIFVLAPFLKELPDWMKLAILGTALETSRRYLTNWFYALKDAMFITVVFDSDDTSFQWMMSWIARQPGFNKSRYMEVTTRYSSSEGSSILFGDEEAVDDDDKALKYIPSPSIAYSLWYKRRWVEVTRTKTGGSSYYDSETDRLTVRILTRNRRLVNSLLLEAKRLYATANEESVCVYVNDQADQWRFVASRSKRPMRSIILDPGVKDLLLEDARDFLDSKDWYNSRGIAHRRGYLLHGKPGSGKTSLIQAIAGELGLNVYIISLSRAGLDDTTLASAIGELPSRCIALMEDLDAAFHRGITREQEDSADDGDDAAGGPKAGPKGPPASRITLSGLLNALDGVGAQEGRILFATTNRYNVLDSALIRPGRLDLHIEFKHASTFQIEELFRTFYQPDIRKEKEKDVAKPASDTEEVPAVVVEDVPLIDLDTEKPMVAPLTPASTRSGSPASEGTPSDSSAHAKAGITVGISHSTRAPAFTEAQYDQLAEQFGAQIPSDTFSMAALQGYLMSWKIDPRGAVKNVRVWVDKELRERKKKEPKVAEVEETAS